MADTGGGHVVGSTPQESHGEGKVDSRKIDEIAGETRVAQSGGQVYRELKEQSEPEGKSGSVVERADLGDKFRGPAPAHKRTRKFHRLDAAYTPTKTHPSAEVLAAHGITAAKPQTQQLLKAIGPNRNNPLHSGAHQSFNRFAGNSVGGATPQPALRSGLPLLGLAPQFQRRVSLSQHQYLSQQSLPYSYPWLFAPSIGYPFSLPLYQQTAKMGAGYSGATGLLNSPRGNRQSTAPTATKENDETGRQSKDLAQATQNKQPQSYGTSGIQAMTTQTHLTMIAHSVQSFGANQQGYNNIQSQQPSMQQYATFGQQNQSSFGTQSSYSGPQQIGGGGREVLRQAKADYSASYQERAPGAFDSAPYGFPTWDRSEQQKASQTKSPSEYSFKQMPGGFDPRWSRGSFDTLPPPSIASDHQSTVFALHHTTGEQQMPSAFTMSERLSSGGVVTALQPVMEGDFATQPNRQEPQEQEPQNAGRSNREPRELAAQAQEFSQQAPAPGSAVSQQPLMRPSPGFEENGASFSVSEAQNDSQNTRPPPGFEPIYPDVAAPPTQGELSIPQPSSKAVISTFTSHISDPYQAPNLAVEQKLGPFKPVRTVAEVTPKPSPAANTRASELSLLHIQANNNGVFQPLAQSTSHNVSHASEQKQSKSAPLLQEMGSQTDEPTQQYVVAESARGGFSMEDIETVEQLGANQEMPAHLEEKFRNLIPLDSDSESDFDDERSAQLGGRCSRAISPPRILGGIHHASRHSSSRRSSDGGRSRSRSSARRSQSPLQHTQPRAQLPLLPAPPGIVYMPSPYATARPARAGDETSTAQFNRLLLIAHQDGYMPKHLTLFTDTSHAGFEKEFPQFSLVPRGSMSYRLSYTGWERNNRTHVPPRIIQAASRNWTNMPGSGAWFETVDPRDMVQDTASTTEKGREPFPNTRAVDRTKTAKSTEIDMVQPSVLSSTTQHTKGKGPMVNVPADEENKDTSDDEYSVDDAEEAAMMQHAIELSRRESLPKIPVPNVAGPARKETSRQWKLSAEAAPFMAPATENVIPESEKRQRGENSIPESETRKRGSRGRRGSRGGKHSRASSQASTPSRPGSVPATPASKSSSLNSTPARPALEQTQQFQARIPAAQIGRIVSGEANPAASVTKGNTMAYIPNISTSITPTAIRNVLSIYGGGGNLEIDRRKGWGFVEFSSPAGFQAAVAANPHRIGKEAIRVQQRTDKHPATPPTKARQQSAKPAEKPLAIFSLAGLQTAQKAVAKTAETPEVRAEPKIAWPNAPKPIVRPLQAAPTDTKEWIKQAPLPVTKPVATTSSKPVVKAVPKAPKPKSLESPMAEEEIKPSVLLEPPKTPPKFRQFIIPATPTTPRTQALIQFHTTGDQDRTLLALPELEEVLENPPIIKKSAKTSKRAVEKAAKKAKALLAKEARAEVAGARLGMGKAVLQQIGALPDVEIDVTTTDEETGKKIKKPAAPKKIVVKGIEIIPGVEINENHSKDVFVDRSMIKDKFVISRGQLKEVDLEKKARKEQEVAATQLAHKVRAAEMKSRGKALASSSAEGWEEEEDRIAATEFDSARQTRRGSSTSTGAGGAPVLMPLGADFGGWKTTMPPPPPPPLFIDTRPETRPDPSERPNTAMSMRSTMSDASSKFLAPFQSATLPGPKDPSLFVEPEVIPPPLNRHVVPAQSLSEIIAAEAALRGDQLEKPAGPVKLASTSSWAQLAAAKSPASTSADTSRRGSSEVIQLRSRSVSAVGNKNFMSRFSKAPVAVQSITYDTNIENKRAVFILGVPQSTNLTDISDSVSSGAYGQIYKIEFAIDADTGLRLAGILFRDAGGVVEGLHGKGWGAIGYHHALKNARDADYLREPPLWPWPVDAPISIYLMEYPEEELMRRMHHVEDRAKKGACVTRRLTIINKVQFHAEWHEEEMIAFCYANGVKKGNVQKCCVHNFGNSTIVFGSVEDAVMMRGKLLDKFKESKGMGVTFSSCPGENKGPMTYKRDNAYLRHLEQTMGVDVEQEIEEGHYKEKKRRNSRWSAY